MILHPPPFIHQAKQPDAPLLLFLHGIGEGFDNNGDKSLNNLYKQGPPKFLHLGKAHELLRTQFTVLAPRLPDRATSWEEAEAEVASLVASHNPKGLRRLYVAGFSKGGLGALKLAPGLRPKAALIVDASPMTDVLADEESTADASRRELDALGIPIWAIHTNYPKELDQYRFQRFNTRLIPEEHRDYLVTPPRGRTLRTLKHLTLEPAKNRHGEVCNLAFGSPSVYEWLLKH